jgi:ATP-dependent Clp protease ATP-binding subunit ClpX
MSFASSCSSVSPDGQSTRVVTAWTPERIHRALSVRVKGQDCALEALSVVVYEHLIGIAAPGNCALMIGPSGSGKTLCATTIADLLRIPISVVNAAALVSTGIVGSSVTTIFEQFVESGFQQDFKLGEIEHGIVILDEFDKLLPREGHTSTYGSDTISQLLAIIQGTTVPLDWFEKRRRSGSDVSSIRTHQMLFVLAGAWSHLQDVPDLDPLRGPSLQSLGMPVELQGRIGAMIPFRPLSMDDLIAILEDYENGPWSSFLALLRRHGVRVEMRFDMQVVIAREALKAGLGARGCRQIIQDATKHLRYQIPSMPKGTELVLTTAHLRRSP